MIRKDLHKSSPPLLPACSISAGELQAMANIISISKEPHAFQNGDLLKRTAEARRFEVE